MTTSDMAVSKCCFLLDWHIKQMAMQGDRCKATCRAGWEAETAPRAAQRLTPAKEALPTGLQTISGFTINLDTMHYCLPTSEYISDLQHSEWQGEAAK